MALALLAVLLLAPAPFRRPLPGVAGEWHDRDGCVRVTLGADGTYAEDWRGLRYAGRWEADGRRLCVTCRLAAGPGDTPPPAFRVLTRGGGRLEMGTYSLALERVP